MLPRLIDICCNVPLVPSVRPRSAFRQERCNQALRACIGGHGARCGHKGPAAPAGMHACSVGLQTRPSLQPRDSSLPHPLTMPPTQIEFYFSDSNLPRDKFLQEKVAADGEGYVDIALLSIFQRVRGLLKSTIVDPAKVSEETVADVADALEGSSSLALSDDRKRVRRAAALKQAEEVGAVGAVGERPAATAGLGSTATLQGCPPWVLDALDWECQLQMLLQRLPGGSRHEAGRKSAAGASWAAGCLGARLSARDGSLLHPSRSCPAHCACSAWLPTAPPAPPAPRPRRWRERWTSARCTPRPSPLTPAWTRCPTSSASTAACSACACGATCSPRTSRARCLSSSAAWRRQTRWVGKQQLDQLEAESVCETGLRGVGWPMAGLRW